MMALSSHQHPCLLGRDCFGIGIAHGVEHRLGLRTQFRFDSAFRALVDAVEDGRATLPGHTTDTPTFAPAMFRSARRLLDTPTTACLAAA